VEKYLTRSTASLIKDCFWIVTIAVVIALFLRPFQNTPFIDDWTYAWPVEHFLQTGELRILDWSTSVNVTQILWGALFCIPFGFSFTALRISTFVLSLGGLCGFYLLLRELDVKRRGALIGTALLGAYPVYFVLSFSFMTDVPALALSILFSLCAVKAVRGHQTWWLAMASVLAVLALGTRLTSIALPFALLAMLVLHTGEWGRNLGRIAIALAPIAAVGVLSLWQSGHIEHRADLKWIIPSPAWRVANLKYGLLYPHRYLLVTILSIAGALGPVLLPCVAGQYRRVFLRRTLGIGIVLLAALAIKVKQSEYYVPLTPGETWAFSELGATEALVANFQQPPESAQLRVISAIVAAVLFAMAVAPVLRRTGDVCVRMLYWLFGFQAYVMLVLWLFFDRYGMGLLPFLLALILASAEFVRPLIGGSLVACLLALSIVGTQDHLSYNAALWRAVDHLRQHGVKPSDIDGWYVVNGWFQYAHPENAARDLKGDVIVPGVNAGPDSVLMPYRISNTPIPGWSQFEAIPYRRRLGRSGLIYVLYRPAHS